MGGSSKIILGMLLGGMITVDMGGPINKAAYVFGTASIASGNYGSRYDWWDGSTTCYCTSNILL